MDIVVAQKALVAESAEGNRLPIRVTIGRPFKVAEQTWSCPLRLEGLGAVSDGLGTDSWAALTVAIGVARQHLEHRVANGDRITCGETGDEVAIEDLFPKF